MSSSEESKQTSKLLLTISTLPSHARPQGQLDSTELRSYRTCLYICSRRNAENRRTHAGGKIPTVANIPRHNHVHVWGKADKSASFPFRFHEGTVQHVSESRINVIIWPIYVIRNEVLHKWCRFCRRFLQTWYSCDDLRSNTAFASSHLSAR